MLDSERLHRKAASGRRARILRLRGLTHTLRMALKAAFGDVPKVGEAIGPATWTHGIVEKTRRRALT